MDYLRDIILFDEGDIGVSGEVFRVDLREGICHMQIADGSCVPFAFPKKREGVITDALHQHDVMRLWVRGRGEFGPSGNLVGIGDAWGFLMLMNQPPPDPNRRPIGEIIDEIVADVPDEEWAKLPTDLSHRHDYYLYGVEEPEELR